MTNKFNPADFTIEGIRGMPLYLAMQMYKTRYADLKDFSANVLNDIPSEEFKQFCSEIWDCIVPFRTSVEILQIRNVEYRRAAYSCYGVERIFKEMQPELANRQVIEKKNHRWDEKNIERVEKIWDVYELYKFPEARLYPEPWIKVSGDRYVYMVRCWCTSTQREYLIYVPPEIGRRNDAVEAIAWTLRLNITNPKRLYRQGDVLIAEMSADSKVLPEGNREYNKPLTKDQYLKLMYSET